MGLRSYLQFVSAAVLLLMAGIAAAQEVGQCPTTTTTVRRSACPPGATFEEGGTCSRSNWLGHRSHCRLADCGVCRDGERLAAATGECVREVSSTVGTRACPADSIFQAGGTCGRSNWMGHRSHCRLQDCSVCGEDQILDLDDGLCCDAPD